MAATGLLERINGPQSAIPVQRQWPQLGRELLTLERALTANIVTYENSLTEQEKMSRKERFKHRLFAQLYRDEEKYSRDERYRAYLFVKEGRGGEIAGNPYYVDTNGKKQELPYTGLEGYYAGTVRTSAYPGITQEEMIQEEAHVGAELLRTIKKHAIEKYTWSGFAKMMKALEGGEPDVEDLKKISVLWAQVVRKLHLRVYDNVEFEMTLTEQIDWLEKLLCTTPEGTEEEKAYKTVLQAEYQRLKAERNSLSDMERERERRERRERERTRRERLRAYNNFREETYALLNEVEDNSAYGIQVSDLHWKDATIIETIHFPKTRSRNEYAPIEVNLMPEQLKGYLFLAELGDIGGDPLARSVLNAE
jgi:hypothetical protein